MRPPWKAESGLSVFPFSLLFLLILCATAVPALRAGEPGLRPAQWAQPLTRPGLPNLYKVSDQLYRGAQPEKEGYDELRRLGIRTVVNLRKRGDREKIEIEQAGMRYVSLPTNTFFPRRKHFRAFLALCADPEFLPLFIHCRRGADRTGTAVALYRIFNQDWTVAEALREMSRGGYKFQALHFNLKWFIRSFTKREACFKTKNTETLRNSEQQRLNQAFDRGRP